MGKNWKQQDHKGNHNLSDIITGFKLFAWVYWAHNYFDFSNLIHLLRMRAIVLEVSLPLTKPPQKWAQIRYPACTWGWEPLCFKSVASIVQFSNPEPHQLSLPRGDSGRLSDLNGPAGSGGAINTALNVLKYSFWLPELISAAHMAINLALV